MTTKPTCPNCGSQERMGVIVRGACDAILFWRCQACDLDYHRFSDARMREKAERYMNQEERK